MLWLNQGGNSKAKAGRHKWGLAEANGHCQRPGLGGWDCSMQQHQEVYLTGYKPVGRKQRLQSLIQKLGSVVALSKSRWLENSWAVQLWNLYGLGCVVTTFWLLLLPHFILNKMSFREKKKKKKKKKKKQNKKNKKKKKKVPEKSRLPHRQWYRLQVQGLI